MKIVFWVVARCDMVKIGQHFRDSCLPDDGGTKHMWNAGRFLRDCTEQRPRKQPCPRFEHVSTSTI
jgi:hypothetical protein